jgi:UDP-N-acetylglucosamine 4,6-dehydratase (inverting)|tara:strand:- start:796 stop:1803 length:1008 start_codon:yes stop_codon:yes gene_type:complete
MNKKNILITGGTGSFGKKFVETILKKFKPRRLIVYSRDEQKQFQMQQKWKENTTSPIRYFIGDVRDLDRLKFATQGVDIVIHAAALKHVPVAEYNPFEAVKTNILGAQNVIDASIQNNVKKVIALSTDKASSPINLYGATKLTSDKLFIAANNYKGSKNIKFSVVRYGNVMGSRGSVVPFFLKMKKNNTFPVTDKRMTRFNITLEESVKFVISSLDKMWGGEIFVPKIPSYRILDLAKSISPKAKIKFIGLRPGEKIHEEMISESDSINTIEYNNHFVVTSSSQLINWDKKKYMKLNKFGKNCTEGFSYNSGTNNNFLKIDQLKKLIDLHLTDIE